METSDQRNQKQIAGVPVLQMGQLVSQGGPQTAAGLALGVNAFNALTLGLLGLPGLGLLFLFRWVGT